MPKWSDFVNWVFFGVLGYFAFQLTTSVSDMSRSIQDLNVKMAVVVVQIQGQAKDVEKLEGRVEKLESKRVR